MKILTGISSGQVLQRLGRKRGAGAVLTGTTSSEDGVINAFLHGRSGCVPGWAGRKVGRASRRKFRVILRGIPIGGPYTLVLTCGGERASVSRIFVGDVWLLAGQSNMQGVGNLSGAAPPHPQVRVFTMRREWRQARDPLHLTAESPDVCHNGGQQCLRRVSESMRRGIKGTGVGIFFARAMISRTRVPQGLIATAHGGTSMRQWDPALKGRGPASLYASMLASVASTGQPVAGVLWYQGESDAGPADAPHYTGRMRDLVRAARRDLRQPGLPWVMVQLARRFGDAGAGSRWWNSIQDQQRLLPVLIRRLETVAAVDLPQDDRIHVGADGFQRLGGRMALAMSGLMARPSSQGVRPPRLGGISLSQAGGQGSLEVDVVFRDAAEPLTSIGEPSGFYVTNERGEEIPVIYRTSLHGNTARLHLVAEACTTSLQVGYGSGFTPVCNISDARGFALPVFSPQRAGAAKAWLPFVTDWAQTGVLPVKKPLRSLDAGDLRRVPHSLRTSGPGPDGFVNENPRWSGHSGHAFFVATLSLPEVMRLEFLMGYDGPFALWLDGRRFFLDENGINPAVADSARKAASLEAGLHEIRVAMDLNCGAAWGFFLRFTRLDVSKSQILSGQYARPSYLPAA